MLALPWNEPLFIFVKANTSAFFGMVLMSKMVNIRFLDFFVFHL